MTTYHYAMFNRFELKLTLDDALGASHQGQCDEDVQYLVRVPYVAKQLRAIEPDALRAELKEYGAWDTEELANHEDNLQRILWIAACNIKEEQAA